MVGTYDDYIEIVDYLNAHTDRWYTWREWTWAEVGFFATWLGFEPKGVASAQLRHCELCRTETDGPLCDRCARKLRRDCQLVRLAITCRAGVGSRAVDNLRHDEELLAKYDEWKEAQCLT